MQRIDLPYFDKRNATIDTIVIHAVAYDVKGAIESFREHEVSPHYLIDEKGKIYQFVDECQRAWHAGLSFWQGQTNLNDRSIGIELCSKNFGQKPYPMRQISALIRLCQRLQRKYHIKKERILGHSDIAPLRKADPGKAFPWGYLSRRGLGVWYHKKYASKIALNDEVELLGLVGYDTADLNAAKVAFIRHFMGNCVLDESVENLIENPSKTPICANQQEYLSILQAVVFSCM